MTQGYGAIPQAPPQMPPPVFLPPPQRSRWPTVFGVISTILGALGVLCTPVGMWMNMSVRNPQWEKVLSRLPAWYETYYVVSQFIGIAVSVFLLAAGIALLKRRPAGRTLHVAYGWINIASVVIGTSVTAVVFSRAELPEALAVGFRIWTAVGVLLGLAYPIIVLVWMARAKVKQEVAEWAGTGAYQPNVYQQRQQ